MERTEHCGLKKPGYDDFGDVGDLNENAEVIDAVLHDLDVNKADLEDGKVPESQLPRMDFVPREEKGSPGGVASLGGDGKVPVGQLPNVGGVRRINSAYGGPIDLSDASLEKGNYFAFGISAATALAVANATCADGTFKEFELEIWQEGGPHAVTWWPNIVWLNGTPVMKPGSNKVTFRLYGDGRFVGNLAFSA